ncbi:hypothetical protein ACHAXR_008977 [Thalassiosira sp. AJA248-18]
MASNIIKKRILVLGGNGYVGQNICHAAIQSNAFASVRSLNRSGAPSSSPDHLVSSLSEVDWISGDIFDKSAREDAMSEVDAVVSCIGAFGSNDFMQRICGDATIEAIRTARENGVSKFGFVSSAQVYEGSVGLKLPPSAPMHGYFQGKLRAEKELLQYYPEGHVIVRPGFIYGPRSAGGHTLPLQLVGGPISFVGTQLGPISSLIQSIPFVGTECSSMVPVECVGRAMVESLGEMEEGKKGAILDAEAIRKF